MRSKRQKSDKVFITDRALNLIRIVSMEEALTEWGTDREKNTYLSNFYNAIAKRMKIRGNRVLMTEHDYNNQQDFRKYCLEVKQYTTIFEEYDGDTYIDPRTKTLISKEDIDKICFNLHIADSYVQTSLKNPSMSLHRYLMDPPIDMVVDHKDGDTFNNRRENLRICPQYKNTWNRRMNNPTKYTKTSKYKGVSEKGGGFRLETSHKKVRIRKYFRSEERAAIYYDIISIALKGEYAVTNAPKDSYDAELINRFYRLYLKNFHE